MVPGYRPKREITLRREVPVLPVIPCSGLITRPVLLPVIPVLEVHNETSSTSDPP